MSGDKREDRLGMECVKGLSLAQGLWLVQRTGLCEAENQDTWVQAPARSGAGCVTMGRSRHLSMLFSPHRAVVRMFNVYRLLAQGPAPLPGTTGCSHTWPLPGGGRTPVPLSLEKQKARSTGLRGGGSITATLTQNGTEDPGSCCPYGTVVARDGGPGKLAWSYLSAPQRR